MKNIKIIIATHKKYNMPIDDIYLPVHVGKQGKEYIGYIGDDTGDNISSRNSSYCELTGLYWAWKNLKYDYLGLSHYRRHFTVKSTLYRKVHDNIECVLTADEAKKLVSKYKVIVPKKRKYYIETLYSHYAHTHYKEHLDITRKIIKEKYPEYLEAFDWTMKQRSGYMFNMFIMDKDTVNKYCEWLFDILFEVENRIGSVELSQFQSRFYGRISEIIFNCWLKHNNISVKEIGCMHMEKINWNKKFEAFFKAKFLNQKYEGSF